MRKALFILWLICLPAWVVSDDVQTSKDPVFNSQLSDALQQELENVREILGSDNIAAAIYISDRCYWEGAAGATRQNPEVAVTPDMLFGFGSITKTFIASIVLQLAEENKLSLEEPLGTWLPRYPNIDPNITVRLLLNHGSRLSGYFLRKRFRREVDANPDRVWQPEDILKYVRAPQGNSSTTPSYSNTNYILLGMIIEAVTGNSLEDELQSRIARPLHLDNTYLPKQDFNPERWADNTRLYSSRFSSSWAAGAIASIPREIAKWSHMLYSGNFLDETSMKQMLITEPRRIGRTTFPMGLGVWQIGKGAKLAWGHGGVSHPFKSATLYVPKHRTSIAYSFRWTDSGDNFLPLDHLMRAYIANRPDDITMCFD